MTHSSSPGLLPHSISSQQRSLEQNPFETVGAQTWQTTRALLLHNLVTKLTPCQNPPCERTKSREAGFRHAKMLHAANPVSCSQVHAPRVLWDLVSPSATSRHDGGSKSLTPARSLRADEAASKHGVAGWPSSSWIKCSATAGCRWTIIGKQSAQ